MAATATSFTGLCLSYAPTVGLPTPEHDPAVTTVADRPPNSTFWVISRNRPYHSGEVVEAHARNPWDLRYVTRTATGTAVAVELRHRASRGPAVEGEHTAYLFQRVRYALADAGTRRILLGSDRFPSVLFCSIPVTTVAFSAAQLPVASSSPEVVDVRFAVRAVAWPDTDARHVAVATCVVEMSYADLPRQARLDLEVRFAIPQGRLDLVPRVTFRRHGSGRGTPPVAELPLPLRLTGARDGADAGTDLAATALEVDARALADALVDVRSADAEADARALRRSLTNLADAGTASFLLRGEVLAAATT